MGEKPNDGGPAFPFAATDASNVPMQAQGMSLRDWFAGQALAGDAANTEEGCYDLDCTDRQLLNQARLYYRIADAMLAARGAK